MCDAFVAYIVVVVLFILTVKKFFNVIKLVMLVFVNKNN